MTLSLENGERLQEASEADCDHQQAHVASGTSARGIEPGAYEPPAGSECQGRIGTSVDVVLAVDDHQERADPDGNCGEPDQRAARVGHLISKVMASALSSLLGMKPCAGQAIDFVAEVGSVTARSEDDRGRRAVCGKPLGDLEAVEIGQPDIQQHHLGLQFTDGVDRRGRHPQPRQPPRSRRPRACAERWRENSDGHRRSGRFCPWL